MKLYWLNLGMSVLMFLFVVFTVGVYIKYAADNISEYTNYFISVAVLPFIYGSLIGYLATVIMPKESIFRTSNRIIIMLSVGAVALLPTLVFLIAMYLPHTT